MATLNEYLPETAQRHLASLRASVDDRLAALEEVLADPSRGESLEGLILDLSRVASEEAQAAAAKAVLDVQTQAEKDVAEARATMAASGEMQLVLEETQIALEREREQAAELRRAVEEAHASAHAALEQEVQQRVAAVQRDADSRIAAAVERAVQQKVAAVERDTQKKIEAAVREAEQRAEQAAQQRIAELEQSVEQEIHSATAPLEAELARLRAGTQDLERAVADARQHLEEERAAATQVRQDAEQAQARIVALEREQEDARGAAAALARVQSELDGERTAGKALHAELDAERAKVREWQQTAERAQADAAATAAADSPQRKAAVDALTSQVAAERKAAAELQKALASVEAQLEAERSGSGGFREAAEQAERRLASVMAENVQQMSDHQQIATQLAEARAEIDSLRAKAGMPSTAPPRDVKRPAPAPAPAAAAPAAAPPADSHATTGKKKAAHASPGGVGSPQVEPEGGWESIRMFPRHAFEQDLDVQVNGSAGRLFDLSIGGCQILSPSPLKPNQVVKVSLPDSKTAIACTGKVVWARLEPARAGRPLGYRAGLSFTKRDEAAIEAFMVRHGAKL